MNNPVRFLLLLITIIGLFDFATPIHAAIIRPPALSIANFVKYKFTLTQCEQRATAILEQMNFQTEYYGAGTIRGYGEQSVVSVDCHQLQDSLFIQVVVSSQRAEVSEIIKNYLLDYLRGSTEKLSNSPCLHPNNY